jgi:hypothetical protein
VGSGGLTIPEGGKGGRAAARAHTRHAAGYGRWWLRARLPGGERRHHNAGYKTPDETPDGTKQDHTRNTTKDPSELFRAGVGAVIDRGDLAEGELGVALGGGEALMAEKLLDGAEIGAFLQQVRTEGMAKGMRVCFRR